MAFTNNIMIVRHRLLTELVKLWKNGELTTDKIDRLPLELSPRRSKSIAGRCCVHKERACMEIQIPSSTGVGYG